MLSYNQIIKANKDFRDSHLILKTFFNGEKWQHVEHNQQKKFKYPHFFLEDQPHASSNGEYVYQFKAWFFQKVPTLKERGNDSMRTVYNDAKSDMIQCAQDLITFWVQDINFDFLTIDKNITIDTFVFEGDDWTAGCSFDLKLSERFIYDNCVLPLTSTPTPEENDVDITVNDTTFISIACGQDFNLEVINQDLNEVGAPVVIGGVKKWQVNTSGDPATNSMNGTELTDIPPGGDKDFTIRHEDNSPVVVTTVTDNATTFLGEVPNPTAAALNTANIYVTGQATSNNDNDDGDLKRGRGVDWFNLSFVNPWGHSKRFTGTTGGYYDEVADDFKDVDGDVTTKALAFPDDLVSD